MLPCLAFLVACDAPSPQPEAPPPSGVVARIVAASCGLPVHTEGALDGAFYAASVDVQAATVAVNTWAAASGAPPLITPLAAELRCEPSVPRPGSDMPLAALVERAWTCAQELGSVGGSPLKNEATVSWVVSQPERVTVSFPEVEARTRPSGRDVVVALRTGACSPAVMD